jgi:hypothetical protein
MSEVPVVLVLPALRQKASLAVVKAQFHKKKC